MMARSKKGMLLSLFLVMLLTSCAIRDRLPPSGTDRSIKIRGSDTMLLLVQRWAREFMREHPEISIYTEGGGSGLGITDLINGKTDICASSRPMEAEEIRRLAEKQGSLGISILCARDAISIYLHPGNRIQDLSLSQLRNILWGSIRNWNEIGGNNGYIQVISRNPNSGTYLFLEQRVLMGTPCTQEAIIVPTAKAVVETVSTYVNAIGYGGMALGEKLYHCKIDGIAPTAANVRNGTYPLSRHLYFFTIFRPQGLIKEFIDWALSEKGQRFAAEEGYIPLFDM